MATVAPPTRRQRAQRRFSRLVDDPMLEDYSLRYAPTTFRRWKESRVVAAALGGIAFPVDFAIGASLAITFGFTNALFAILLAAVVIFLTSFPIAYYAAKYSIDMDLLTRGAGFGYFGSTITSLIYATFTIIFFALEGSIMAQAFEIGLGLPLWLGYLIVALVVIPLVIFGMTALSKMQAWTTPIWLLLLLAPLAAILVTDAGAFSEWTSFAGEADSSGLNALSLGIGAGIALSLVVQIAEQVDYLRFMPPKTPENSKRWWAAVVAGGPGWVILGAFKQLVGAFLAFYIAVDFGLVAAGEPIEQFIVAFDTFLPSSIVVGLAVFFILLGAFKINVTNAYAGSLAWSNFFSRVLHRHPGRIVWVFFNVAIALVLMQIDIFSFLNTVLGFYSNVAIAWIGAVVADLVIIKPLKLSPSYIEFKRAHLFPINPVGFGALLIASTVSIAAYFGAFGETLDAYSPFLALVVAMVAAPLIAVATKGRYYIARESAIPWGEPGETPVALKCTVCEQDYEAPDMAQCPFHSGPICSLCCTLEKTCDDMCKAKAEGPAQKILAG